MVLTFEITDAIVRNNHIYRTIRDLWLDWGSQGVAGVHNLIWGDVWGGADGAGGGRLSYIYEPHSTISLGKAPNLGGDWQWYNNLLTQRNVFGNWDRPKHPIKYDGNVITDFKVNLVGKTDGWYLSIDTPLNLNVGNKRKLITSKFLGKAIVPNQDFTNPDRSQIIISTDYLGKKRNTSNPIPGPIEMKKADKLEWKVW